MYPVCRSVIGLSCVDVIPSFTYVLRVVILTSLNDVWERERERESATESEKPTASRRYHQKKKKKKKQKEQSRQKCTKLREQ